MTELEMTNEVETEEFTDELSDEALDREEGGKLTCQSHCTGPLTAKGQIP